MITKLGSQNDDLTNTFYSQLGLQKVPHQLFYSDGGQKQYDT